MSLKGLEKINLDGKFTKQEKEILELILANLNEFKTELANKIFEINGFRDLYNSIFNSKNFDENQKFIGGRENLSKIFGGESSLWYSEKILLIQLLIKLKGINLNVNGKLNTETITGIEQYFSQEEGDNKEGVKSISEVMISNINTDNSLNHIELSSLTILANKIKNNNLSKKDNEFLNNFFENQENKKIIERVFNQNNLVNGKYKGGLSGLALAIGDKNGSWYRKEVGIIQLYILYKGGNRDLIVDGILGSKTKQAVENSFNDFSKLDQKLSIFQENIENIQDIEKKQKLVESLQRNANKFIFFLENKRNTTNSSKIQKKINDINNYDIGKIKDFNQNKLDDYINLNNPHFSHFFWSSK